jgi:tRNA-dihydrouridine synthase
MNKLLQLPKPFLVLAPMDDVTDSVFRRIVADCAPPDLFFTEFVNVDGLQSPGRDRLLKKLRFTDVERPLIAQLWGLKPENFKAIARQIADGTMAREFGLPKGANFAGVDLNMGCPAKSEVRAGACAALIKRENWGLAKEIIDATREGLAARTEQLSLSVKTRVGFNQVDMDWIDYLLDQNLDMLTVHGRTRAQMSKVPANWELIGEARERRDQKGLETLIVGNGDVESRKQALELAAEYRLDGIMAGRGIFHDPYLFAPISPWETLTKTDRIQLYRKHVSLFASTWQKGERNVATLNKFCKVYVSGFDGAKELREELMQADSVQELLNALDEATALRW